MTLEPLIGRLDVSETHKEIFSNTSTPMAHHMEFDGKEILRLRSFTVIAEYEVRLS